MQYMRLAGAPGRCFPLVLDDDVEKAIQKKLLTNSRSLVVIIDVHTVDVSHVGPRTQNQIHRLDPVVPDVTIPTTEAPRTTDTFALQAQEQLREEMIQTLRELQDLWPLELPTLRILPTSPDSAINIYKTILQQIKSQKI
jgi:hypothetical protein